MGNGQVLTRRWNIRQNENRFAFAFVVNLPIGSPPIVTIIHLSHFTVWWAGQGLDQKKIQWRSINVCRVSMSAPFGPLVTFRPLPMAVS